MLFPGQGSQYIGMCSELYYNNDNAKKLYNTAYEILGFDLWNMIEKEKLQTLTKSKNAQPAILVSSYVLYQEFFNKFGQLPTIAVGHSLGEISALMCAGSLTFEDGVSFVKQRGILMDMALEEKIGFCGIVTDVETEVLESVIQKINETGYVTITGYNSPNQLMVGGEKTVERLLDDQISSLSGQYIPFRMIPMKANAPYHSKLMEFLKPKFTEILSQVNIKSPAFPILSTVSGELIDDASKISESLINQLVTPVKWTQALEKLKSMGIECLVDIGPNKIVKNLALENPNFTQVWAYDEPEDFDKLQSLLSK